MSETIYFTDGSIGNFDSPQDGVAFVVTPYAIYKAGEYYWRATTGEVGVTDDATTIPSGAVVKHGRLMDSSEYEAMQERVLEAWNAL